MQKHKIKILLLLLFLTIVSSRWAKISVADDTLAKKLKGKILLQVEEKGQAWYVFPSDLKMYSLGKPSDALNLMKDLGLGITNQDLSKVPLAEFTYDFSDSDSDGLPDSLENALMTDPSNADSDNDGYSDKDEIYNNYNPLGKDKLVIDYDLASKLSGQIVLQVENKGEAWYINPDNQKRYFMGRPIDALNLMRKLGLGISNENLAKIDEIYVKPEQTNDYIVKNHTTPTADNTRVYSDDKNNYTLAYPVGWKIRKFDTSPNEIQLTNADRDFIQEKKAVISIHKLTLNESAELNNFKIAMNNDKVKTLKEEDTTIDSKEAYETAYMYPAAYQRTILVALNDKEFLRISLISEKSSYTTHEKIFQKLIDSLKIN